MKTASLDKRISAWLLQTLKSVPAEANLISLDWNESSRGRGRSKEKVVLLSMGAFVHPDDEPFDPEDPDHLDLSPNRSGNRPTHATFPKRRRKK
jgi:hypothetical protein